MLSTPYEDSFERTASSSEKKTCDTEIKIELSLESDTNFQSFLLPLEQDLTKSSKGYASLLSIISNNENSVNSKNKSELSKMNDMLHCKNFADDFYLINSYNMHLQDNSLYSSGFDHSSNADDLYFGKYAQFIDDTLENIKIDQADENKLLKSTENFHENSQNTYSSDNISEKEQNKCLGKSIKITHNLSINFSNSSNFDKESDNNSSESSETSSFYSACNDSQNCTDSASGDNAAFSEEAIKNKHLYTTKVKQTFETAIDFQTSESSNIDKNSEETTRFILENFEFDSVDARSPVALQRNSYDSVIMCKSEGYINAGFVDDNDFPAEKLSPLKCINESWNDSMKDITGEPHESKRVSFVPLPDLVTVFSYEPEDDDYCYSLYVLDQLRFESRIKDFEHIIAPYLTPEHRANIYQRNCLPD